MNEKEMTNQSKFKVVDRKRRNEVVFTEATNFCTVATFDFTKSEFEQLLGVELTLETEEDRAGPTMNQTLKTSSGVMFYVEYADSFHIIDQRCSIMLNLLKPSELSQSLEEIFEIAGIESTRIMWLHENVSFRPYEVWRQDDNGNEAFVKRCESKSDASILLKRYEDKGHKQLYWIKEVV